MTRMGGCVVLLLTFFSMTAWTQPAIRAVRLGSGERITVDGALSDIGWQRAQPATDFKQAEPSNGAAATQRTEIRIVFDQDNLYIGGEFFDSEPAGILANQMTRDGALNADDRFMWVLDPFYDQRSGYFFEVNPAGAMGDAQLVPSVAGNFGTTQNRAWDGIWLARVRTHDQGWTAEIRIPFRTLNFDPQGTLWGVNFQRTVRRRNEESLWSGWALNQGIFSLAAEGTIEGIHDVSQGHGLDIKPYVIGTYRSDAYKANGGLDFFYSITPQLKANVTFNTDFAHTEVDDRQVNLTRFPLFFPEKRDFFLEGAGNFDFARDTPRDFTAFFTRRIGLDARGRPQKIDYGVKVGGQAGPFNLGLLQVRTADEPGIVGEDFTVLRPKRLFLTQSYAGLIYTRRATRAASIPDRHTIGADFQLATSRFRGSQNLQFNAFYIKTPNGVATGDDASYGLRVVYPNDLVHARVWFRTIQKNFDPAVGFVERANYRRVNPYVILGPRPKNNRWIRQVLVHLQAQLLTDLRGVWIQRVHPFWFDLNMHSGDTIRLDVTTNYERLERDFRITSGITLPAGERYQYTRYGFDFSTASQRPVSGTVSLRMGGFYSGRRRELAAGLSLRPRRGVLATFNTSFNRVELAEGRFSTKILAAIINTQFNPFMSLSNNIQYDSDSRVLGWQSRFRWIVKPGNDVYFVWLNNWIDLNDRLATLDRSAAVKMVYTYRF
jgi:hypothetical protein